MRLPRRLLLVLLFTATVCCSGRGQTAAPAADTSWVSRSALYEIFVQDFSAAGDLDGVTANLDRIQAAGANVVWLMPIHPIGVEGRKGVLGSPYAARDFRAINPAYGTAEDLRELVRAAHARDLRVILDFVPDHTSPDHAWIREHPEYYVQDAQGRPSVPRDGNGNLTDWTDVRQLDYRKPEVRRVMIETLQWWLREFDLDGYRMDVAGFLPYDFWMEANAALRAAVPRRILLLAEWGDAELLRRGFDLVYSWDSYSRLKAVWRGEMASRFVEGEIRDMAAVPAGTGKLRFTTNHDETAWDNPPVAIFGGSAGARAAFVAAVMLPGRPLLYNGQEVESPQKIPLFERLPVEWNQPGADAARAFYAKVLRLVRNHPDVLSAPLEAVETSAPREIIAYRRGRVIVLVNPRSTEQKFTVQGVSLAGGRDLLSGATIRSNEMVLPGYGFAVVERVGN